MRELERDQAESRNAEGAGLPLIAVIGPGRVGRSLARAAADAGLQVSLCGRRDALAACERAEIALLCVPDGAIESACETISAAVPPLSFVGHTSGATDLRALEPATRRGAHAFSLHPLQTFSHGDTAVAGAPCAVTGSNPDAARVAEALATSVGMRPFPVPDEHRSTYHAAAAMASNYLIALEEAAAALLESTGADDARELLAPLVLRTAANWAERGGDALTGPIARGDEATVARHVEAIGENAPELLEVYRALAEHTRSVAARTEPAGDRAANPELAA